MLLLIIRFIPPLNSTFFLCFDDLMSFLVSVAKDFFCITLLTFGGAFLFFVIRVELFLFFKLFFPVMFLFFGDKNSIYLLINSNIYLLINYKPLE